MATLWDPTAYARFGDERTRPFLDLIARIGTDAPEVVVDLGCGNGPATLLLAQRWPGARIVGVDSSEDMLVAARELDVEGRVEWVLGDIAQWDPSSIGAPIDVLVTNAALQWIDGHRDLIRPWLEALPEGGWFAMQVPGNFSAPSHVLMREAGLRHPRSDAILDALRRPRSDDVGDYLETLLSAGVRADVWGTTYLQVLDPEARSDNPVLDWVSGTGLRPVLQALTDEVERAAYLEDYGAALQEAYPRTEHGVVLPFRRLFAVAEK